MTAAGPDAEILAAVAALAGRVEALAGQVASVYRVMQAVGATVGPPMPPPRRRSATAASRTRTAGGLRLVSADEQPAPGEARS